MFDPIAIGNVRFTESYYLVTYHHGFVRRGMLGEILRLLFGVPTRSEVDGTEIAIVVLAVGAVLLLIELLVRRRTAGAYAMAILLAASPFTFDFFIVDRRPDLLAVALLVALGVVLVRDPGPLLAWLVAFGLAFGVMVLVHEDVVLIQVPWAVVLVAVATMDRDGGRPGGTRPALTRRLVARVGALVVPTLLATTAVLVDGLPSPHRVAQLEADVSSWHLEGNTVFTYLADSVGAAVRLVGGIPADDRALTLLLGAILVSLQLGWIALWVRPRLWSPFVVPGHRMLGALLGSGVAVATVVLFATGFDWVRWFADCGASWLIVQAFVPLLGDPEPPTGGRVTEGAGPGGVQLSAWLPAVAVYLAMVPPLDDLFITSQLRHFLLFV